MSGLRAALVIGLGVGPIAIVVLVCIYLSFAQHHVWWPFDKDENGSHKPTKRTSR